MGRPKRKINTIDLKTMSNQQIADLATEDLRRILWDLKKKATLRDQDFEDCFEDLYTLFLSGEIRQDLDEEKLKNGATIGNYMYNCIFCQGYYTITIQYLDDAREID